MRPFLKWAGGKYRVLPHILPHFARGERYIEPFAGSCAVALNTDYAHYLLYDGNTDLIDLYNTIIAHKDTFIRAVHNVFIPENNISNRFYTLRHTFNTTDDSFLKSVLFVYLNRHAFNGLCRYNRSGGFNAPFGKYKKPYMPIKEITHFADVLHTATFTAQDFRDTFAQVQRGDIVYCDPPYVPLSETANFTAYAQQGFTLQDQQNLADCARHAQRQGAKVYISNNDTPITRELYKHARIIAFETNRIISANASSRGKVREILAIYD